MKTTDNDVSFELAMLIDDNDVDNYVSRRAIEGTRFAKRVKTYSSCSEALGDLCQSQHNPVEAPDIIFLDMHMPDADAFTFVREFERLEPLVKDKCKIVILSNMESRETVEKITCNKYVISLMRKPMSKESLAKLKAHLRTPVASTEQAL